MKGLMKKLMGLGLAVCMMASLLPAIPAAAAQTESAADRIYTIEDINAKTEMFDQPAREGEDGTMNIHTTVVALVGQGVNLVVSPIEPRISGQLADLKSEEAAVQLSGFEAGYSYTWTVERKAVDEPESAFAAWRVVGGAADAPYGLSGAGDVTAPDGDIIALPLDSQIAHGDYSLEPDHEYRYTITVTDSASGLSASASVVVVVGSYITDLYDPSDAVWPDFNVWLTGTFLYGSVLEVRDQVSDATQGALEAALGGYAVDKTWTLVADNVLDDEDPVKAVDTMYFALSKEQYDQVVAGNGRFAAIEGASQEVVLYDPSKIEPIEVTKDDVTHYYLKVTKDGAAELGTYALAFRSAHTASVTARVEGTGGQVSYAGTRTWALADAWGNAVLPRYFFVSADGYRVASVVVSDDATGAEVFRYPASALSGIDYLDIAGLQDGGRYTLVATFEPVEGDPTAEPVSVTAKAVDADDVAGPALSAVTLTGAGTLRAGDAASATGAGTLTMSGLQRNTSATIAAASTQYEIVRAEASLDGGATWRGIMVLGNRVKLDALEADAQVRFICARSESGIVVPSYPVKVAIVDAQGEIVADGAAGRAADRFGNVITATTPVPLGGSPDARMTCAANYTVADVYALAADGTTRTSLTGSLRGDETAGFSAGVTVIDEGMTICVRFAPYTAYYLACGRGGAATIDGAKPVYPVKVVEGAPAQTLHVQADTASGYVIDRSKCSGFSFGDAADPIAAINIPLAFDGAQNVTLTVAFKKDASVLDGYIEIDVTVTVPPVAQGARAGARGGVVALADDEQAEAPAEVGGVVTPRYVLIKRESSADFYIYPYNDYNVESVQVTAKDGSTSQTISTDALVPLTDKLMSELASEELEPQTMSKVDLTSGIAALADDEVVYGYLLRMEGLTQSLDMDVKFCDDPGALWGELDTAVIGCGEGGTISPTGTVKIPKGHTLQLALTVLPDAGNRLAHLWVTRDGKTTDIADEVAGDMVNVTLSKGSKVYAEFEPIAVQIYVEENVEHGSIAPSGTLRVIPGEPTRFYFWADEGYALESVHIYYDGDDTDYGWRVAPGTYYVDLDDFEDGMYVTATFAPGTTPEVERCTVRVDAATLDHGSVWPQEMTIAAGDAAQFTYAADEGYVLTGVTAEGASGAVDPSRIHLENGLFTIDDVREDLTVSLTFEEMRFVVVRIDMEVEGGTLAAQDMLEGTLIVLAGTPVDVNVIPDEGYELDGEPVYIEDEEEVAAQQASLFSLFTSRAARAASTLTYSDGVARVVPYASGTLTATFRQAKNVDDTNNPGGSGGSDDPSGSGGSSGADGSGGNGGSGGSGDADGSGAAGRYDFTITATAGAHGSISPSGAVGVNRGQDRTFTFTPDTGYMVESVTVNGESIATRDLQYTMKNVTADSTIHVEFTAKRSIAMASPVDRTVARLTALATTGDFVWPALLALTALACAGGGVALLARRRRNDEEA